ncbi:hypothetical protein V1520DRAFT_88641 [Lipomyces starkeyi]|uniref:Uncharacterized protein n=1 Tax=Lipomyces starkeyi NRRL Y-11557 TaxID=675824 RepID=A0A1E3Q677_LIPST|nr:hypothetical protein LIPSTDRAFT_287259 [Lipomyces starkeyi NRRL Y-11557]
MRRKFFALASFLRLVIAQVYSDAYLSTKCLGGQQNGKFDQCIESTVWAGYQCTVSPDNYDKIYGPGGNIWYCNCLQLSSYFTCWQDFCPGGVNGCAYQFYAARFVYEYNCSAILPKYFTAKVGAYGGCSCPIGLVQYSIASNMAAAHDICQPLLDNVPHAGNKRAAYLSALNCFCCANSGAVSSYYGLCPGYPESDEHSLVEAAQNRMVDVVDIGLEYGVRFDPPSSFRCSDYSLCKSAFGIDNPPAGKFLDLYGILPSGSKVPSATTRRPRSTTSHTTTITSSQSKASKASSKTTMSSKSTSSTKAIYTKPSSRSILSIKSTSSRTNSRFTTSRSIVSTRATVPTRSSTATHNTQ